MFCPFCSSDSGRALREALGDAPIAISLFATLLPFLILAVLVAWTRWLVSTAMQGRPIEPNGAPARKR